MIPIRAHRALCDEQLVVGQHYTVVIEEERSGASHRHFFARLQEIWDSLPDRIQERFPTAEHLRKFCLIKRGFRDERTITFETDTDAARAVAFLKPMDDHAYISHHGCVVTVFTAKSQRLRAMDKAEFQESKQAVLDEADSILERAHETEEA